jgi:lysozyme
MVKLLEQLKRHEGFRTRVYQCTAGRDTIGYGYNLDANPLNLSNYEIVGFRKNGISKEQAETILKIHVAQIETTLTKQFAWFENLNEARQAVLINMTFNLGLKGLLSFKNTLRMIETGDYEGAATNMLKSKWATQVKGRAYELAKQMQNGTFANP